MDAVLVEADVAYACPVTNLYTCESGQHLLITVRANDYVAGIFEGLTGITMPSASRHVTPSVEVFLADERGQVIDYDGDPTNGLTPILSTDPASFAMTIVPDLHTHADALAALGYTVTDTPEES
ncbi:hypothetical protein [Gordonia sp. SCSIO 19800]|uniref:DUF7572 family protein n=1 Tax=Gordonia sp. SCSIO 19800 TaxID=2826926 RepID=UPI001B83FA43|nr:hypothetical protein [Gordonia sp. SCSIO 19800]MBR7191738.1 hypothetical protein [Gordonia sp. SCSIO 19800]